jgi:hypothetical protein
VVTLLGRHRDTFEMKNYLLLAVDLANNKHLEEGKRYFRKALASSPMVCTERGFYAFLKHYIRYTIAN